jgi:predicted AlkP superfamily pyrophosphatase or phosphodiesterase
MKIFFRFSLFVLVLMSAQLLKAQNSSPKIVVGLVVDQMRWDYLYKYKDRYGEDGFNRLLSKGFSCENTIITHLPTYTAVGHAGIYTGSIPAFHGIVGNNWYDKQSDKMVYCTGDSSAKTIGSNSDAGKMSSANLQTTTITDELKLSNNFQSKVIGISLKDRGAILPAGHTANAAYWFDDATGGWISSSCYMNALPQWVDEFNNQRQPDNYMSVPWNTLYPLDTYKRSTEDNKSYEGKIHAADSNVFPHRLDLIKDNKYDAFRHTPFGNTYTLHFAKEAIKSESLGKGKTTDFLAVSLSSPDYIGHTFGPDAVEVEDTYLRLDHDIASFLRFLDDNFGKNQYLVFLSADHGVAHNVRYMGEHNIPSGNIRAKELQKEINDSVLSRYNFKNAVVKVENAQMYLNKQLMNEPLNLSTEIEQYIITMLSQKPFITSVYSLKNSYKYNVPEVLRLLSENSYHNKRSGDIQLVLNPGYMEGSGKGSTHGNWSPYDAHIPLVWFGWGVRKGALNREVHMTDIAPTLAALLHIQMPNGCVGKVIEEVLK